MLGTYANTATIIVGTLIGYKLKKGLSEEQSHILMQAMGLAALALGINSFVHTMPKSVAPILFIVALALGGFTGQYLKLSTRIENLEKKFKNLGSLEGLITAVLLFCVGALSILGPIEAALHNNHTFLFTNATLDLITSMVLASNFGISIIYAAPIVFCWQGSIYLCANFLAPFITDALMAEIGTVGGILILTTGLNILKVANIKTINFLPALLVPPLYFAIIGLF